MMENPALSMSDIWSNQVDHRKKILFCMFGRPASGRIGTGVEGRLCEPTEGGETVNIDRKRVG